MSSLQIAELTGKRHDAILRDIKNLLSQGVAAHNFVVSDPQMSTNQTFFANLFANSGKMCIFATLTVRQTLLSRRAAVNCSMRIGHFLCSIVKDIWRLPIRSHCFVLRGKVCWTVSSVYGDRFLFAYIMT